MPNDYASRNGGDELHASVTILTSIWWGDKLLTIEKLMRPKLVEQ